MNILQLIMLLVCMVCVDARADVVPTIDPVATFHTPDGEDTGLNYTGSAPLTVTLTARAADVGAYTATTSGGSERKERSRPISPDTTKTQNTPLLRLAHTSSSCMPPSFLALIQ